MLTVGGRFVALALCTASPSFAERLSNPTVGISIDKPAAWQVLTASANAENLRKAEIGTPEFQAAIQRYASVPLYAFVKYREPLADVNPSVKLNTRPAGAFAGKSGLQVLEAILPTLSKVMADFVVVEAPQAATIGGRPAGHTAIHYTMKADGASYPARSELWLIPRGDHMIVIGAGFGNYVFKLAGFDVTGFSTGRRKV
jgi:hypothetical protein